MMPSNYGIVPEDALDDICKDGECIDGLDKNGDLGSCCASEGILEDEDFLDFLRREEQSNGQADDETESGRGLLDVEAEPDPIPEDLAKTSGNGGCKVEKSVVPKKAEFVAPPFVVSSVSSPSSASFDLGAMLKISGSRPAPSWQNCAPSAAAAAAAASSSFEEARAAARSHTEGIFELLGSITKSSDDGLGGSTVLAAGRTAPNDESARRFVAAKRRRTAPPDMMAAAALAAADLDGRGEDENGTRGIVESSKEGGARRSCKEGGNRARRRSLVDHNHRHNPPCHSSIRRRNGHPPQQCHILPRPSPHMANFNASSPAILQSHPVKVSTCPTTKVTTKALLGLADFLKGRRSTLTSELHQSRLILRMYGGKPMALTGAGKT